MVGFDGAIFCCSKCQIKADCLRSATASFWGWAKMHSDAFEVPGRNQGGEYDNYPFNPNGGVPGIAACEK